MKYLLAITVLGIFNLLGMENIVDANEKSENAKKAWNVAVIITVYAAIKSKNLDDWEKITENIVESWKEINYENYDKIVKKYPKKIKKYIKVLNREFIRYAKYYKTLSQDQKSEEQNPEEFDNFWKMVNQKKIKGCSLENYFGKIRKIVDSENLSQEKLIQNGLSKKIITQMYLDSKRINILTRNSSLYKFTGTFTIFYLIGAITCFSALIKNLIEYDPTSSIISFLFASISTVIFYIFLDNFLEENSKKNNLIETPDWLLIFDLEHIIFKNLPLTLRAKRYWSTDRDDYIKYLQEIFLNHFDEVLETGRDLNIFKEHMS